jgi:integrase
MLTDAVVRSAKPKDGKLTKLSDGVGLQLWVHPSGKKSWHVAFRVDGRQKSVTIGPYPGVGLKEAREAARSAKDKSRSAPTLTFGAIKADWLAKLSRDGRGGETLARACRMDRYSRQLDGRSIREITPPDILALLRPLEAAGKLETVRRLRATISSIFRFAAALGHVDSDPAALLSGVIASPKVIHRAALIDRGGFARLLRAIDAYESRLNMREALLLLAYTAARPVEIRLARWQEVDLSGAVWTLPPERMKMRQPHRAPLSTQAVSFFRSLQTATCNNSQAFIFPSFRQGRPLSENAFNVALRSMGFAKDEVSAHGFRSSFSTLANESGLWSYDAIERALSHQDASEVRRAYHRADYWDERCRLMQWWADQIDAMRGISALPIRQGQSGG